MTNDKVRFTVHLTINPGKLQAFEALIKTMAAGSQKEAGTLGYEFFLSPDRTRCDLLETYVDANAVLAHIKGPVVQGLVPKLLEMASLDGFDVFGNPGPEAANVLAGMGATIFTPWHGFSR